MFQGYFKLWRKLQDNPLWLSESFTKGQAWVDLIMLANHKKNLLNVRGVMITIKRGQVGASELKLAARWRWSRGKVRRFLKWLKTEQQIEQQKNNVTSLITLINYEKYQGDSTTDDTPNGHQTDTKRYPNKNDKNDKNKKNYCSTSIEIELSQCLLDLILKRNPAYKRPNLQKWAIYIDRMIRIDKREPGGIQEVISWSQSDDFWQNNILSTEKLRKQFDQLLLKMNSGGERKTRLYEEAQSILEYDGEGNFLNYCKENNLKPEEVKSWSL